MRNYCVFILLGLFLFPLEVASQEIKIFTLSDFDLKDNVKSCLVQANYGKEEYDFDTSGRLTKSVTRYSDTDYDISLYKYEYNFLIEKRVENYRDNSFDKKTSIAHLYEIDSSSNRKITEKIISYEKEFIDLYEYHYDEENRLVKILRSNNDGNDETRVEHSNRLSEINKRYFLNDELTSSKRTSEKVEADSIIQKNVLVKKFLEGKPNSAVEDIFDGEGKLISKTEFIYNTKKTTFEPSKILNYSYSDQHILQMVETQEGASKTTSEYIYQFDTQGNWVKEIISPDNTYTTRKITYYPIEETVIEE